MKEVQKFNPIVEYSTKRWQPNVVKRNPMLPIPTLKATLGFQMQPLGCEITKAITKVLVPLFGKFFNTGNVRLRP